MVVHVGCWCLFVILDWCDCFTLLYLFVVKLFGWLFYDVC